MSKPLIIHDDNYEPGGTFNLADASNLIVGNDSWVPALREMAARSLILLRRTDGTLGPTDIAAAVAINALWKSGIQDDDALHAASAALYSWQSEQKASDIHPVSFALWNADRQAWGLTLSRLWLLKDTRQQATRAWCFRVSDPVMPTNDKWRIVSDLTVYLSPLLQPICRRLKAADIEVPAGARR